MPPWNNANRHTFAVCAVIKMSSVTPRCPPPLFVLRQNDERVWSEWRGLVKTLDFWGKCQYLAPIVLSLSLSNKSCLKLHHETGPCCPDVCIWSQFVYRHSYYFLSFSVTNGITVWVRVDLSALSASKACMHLQGENIQSYNLFSPVMMITWWMKVAENLSLGHNALLF